MTYFPAVKFIDENNAVYGIKEIDNRPRISSVPVTFDIARGLLTGQIALRKFGHNSAVAATQETVWDGSDVYAYLAGAEQLQIASADVDDNGSVLSPGTATGGSATTLVDTGATFSTDGVAAGDLVLNDALSEYGVVETVDSETQVTVAVSMGTGFSSGNAYRVVNAGDTGAAVVELTGLNASYAEITEFVVLNGQTNVTTAASFLRVFRLIVRLAGSTGSNEGAITASNNADTVVHAQISATENQTLMALWTVPGGYTAFLTLFYASTSSSKATEVRLKIREFGQVFAVKTIITIFEGADNFPYDFPLLIPEKSDIELTATSAGGGGEVSAGFDLWYET